MTPARSAAMTNFQCRVRPHKTSCDLWSGTYLNNTLSCLSISDQNVNSIARRLRVPPGLDIGVESGIHFNGSLFSHLPRRAGEPGQEQGDDGGARLDGHEQLPDLLEISVVICQVAASSHPGCHGENELKDKNSTQIPKEPCCNKLTSYISTNGSILPFLPSFPHLSAFLAMSCSNVGRTRLEKRPTFKIVWLYNGEATYSLVYELYSVPCSRFC